MAEYCSIVCKHLHCTDEETDSGQTSNTQRSQPVRGRAGLESSLSPHRGNLATRARSPEGPSLALHPRVGEGCPCGRMRVPPGVAPPLFSTGSQVWARWPPTHPAPGWARAWLKRPPPRVEFQVLANRRSGHSWAPNPPSQLSHEAVRRLSPGAAWWAGQVRSTVPAS